MKGGAHPVCAPTAPSSLQEFVKDAGSYSKRMVDDLLDQITGGDHSRMLFQLRQVGCAWHFSSRKSPSTQLGSGEKAVWRASLALLPRGFSMFYFYF